MYTKPEASKLRQEFWTAFGQYMSPVPSAEGEKINWINYRTGVKHIRFTMDANNQRASVTVLINHPEQQIRAKYYDQLLELKSLFSQRIEGVWLWQEFALDENQTAISKIETSISGVSIFERNSWPTIISFLKEKIMGLDSFWNAVKDAFEQAG